MSHTIARADVLFVAARERLHARTSRMFLKLLLGQWVFAVGLAAIISPYAWAGQTRSLHLHLELAIVLGGAMNVLPCVLLVTRPTWWVTRHCVALVQMLWSAMLIMITGGRIETHFHVFGSLAFLAFYRDWKLLATATVVVALDHLVRGVWWPDSVYGISNPEWWRFLEHAAWVVFEDVVLAWGCTRGMAEMREVTASAAKLEHAKRQVERVVDARTRELRDSVEQYRALVEDTAAIPFEYDISAHRVRYASPRLAVLLGDESVHEDAFSASVHPDDRARVAAAFATLTTDDAILADPIDHRMVGADHRVVHVRTFPSHRRGSTVRGIILDVTRHKQLEIELQRAQKLESIGRLAAGVAHEINTPIQFVGDSLEFVQQAVGDLVAVVADHRAAFAADIDDLDFVLGELPRALSRAGEGVERVASIVRSMKAFAHPDRGEMAPADLNAAIRSTTVIARNEYRYVADLDLQLGALPPVLCHVGEINQVVLNMVVNAAHAIQAAVGDTGARGKITVTTYARPDAIEIDVADTGCGIPEHVAPRIFDPFFTTKPVGHGTGQGLAMAHAVVVEKHRGKLTFDSTVGVGTTFHIRIPIAADRVMEVAA